MNTDIVMIVCVSRYLYLPVCQFVYMSVCLSLASFIDRHTNGKMRRLAHRAVHYNIIHCTIVLCSTNARIF